jgi:hypothetical protein
MNGRLFRLLGYLMTLFHLQRIQSEREDDHKWTADKDMKGGGRGLFKDRSICRRLSGKSGNNENKSQDSEDSRQVPP